MIKNPNKQNWFSKDTATTLFSDLKSEKLTPNPPERNISLIDKDEFSKENPKVVENIDNTNTNKSTAIKNMVLKETIHLRKKEEQSDKKFHLLYCAH